MAPSDICISFSVVKSKDDMLEPEISVSAEYEHIISITPPCEPQEDVSESSRCGNSAEAENQRYEYLENDVLFTHYLDLESLLRVALEAIEDGRSIQPAIDALRY